MKWFRKKQTSPTNIKSFIHASDCSNVDRIMAQLKSGFIRPLFDSYFRYYSSIAPLGDAIDLLADQFSLIQPKIKDTKTKEFMDDHPILDLLKIPNTNVSYCEFAKREASFFRLTGNQYWIMTTSGLDGLPLELFVVPPQLVNPAIGIDGRVLTYTYTPQGISLSFTRKDIGRRIKYFSDDGRAQIFVLKEFNPSSAGYYYFGMSKLNSIFYELVQYLLASIHNQSILKQGGRPSGMLSSTEELTNDQTNALRAEFETVFGGETNAGRPIITSNLTWQEFMLSNRDMDFATLKTQMKETIYNRFKIPLALVNSNALSLANMQEAMTQLYDLAIIPLLRQIYDSLTMNVLMLYPGSENLILTFDEATIPALKARMVDQMIKIASFNVSSDNEIRNRIDMPSYEGGDEIYKPSTQVPIGEADSVSNADDDGNGNNGNGDDNGDANTEAGS